MIKDVRENLRTLVNNYKSGDSDTCWMTFVVIICLYGIYFIFTDMG